MEETINISNNSDFTVLITSRIKIIVKILLDNNDDDKSLQSLFSHCDRYFYRCVTIDIKMILNTWLPKGQVSRVILQNYGFYFKTNGICHKRF